MTSNGSDGFALHFVIACLVHNGLRVRLTGKLVKALGAIHITFEFGNVAEVIQGKRIVRVQKVRLVEEFLGLLVIVLVNGGHPVPVVLLDWRGLTLLGEVKSKSLVLSIRQTDEQNDSETDYLWGTHFVVRRHLPSA